MRLRYAGVDVLLEDPDGRVAEHLRRYLNTDRMRHWAENPMWRSDDRQGARFSSGRFVGLPTPNFTDAPPVEINTLYWPSGAARWARCLLLINDEQWTAIQAKVYLRNENQSQTLEFWDEENDVTTTPASGPANPAAVPSIQTAMFTLPPRPVTVRDWPGAATGEKLYLLPLVDVRYWWQFRAVEAFAPETWEEAFTAVEDAIGVDITRSEIPYVYGRPSSVEFRRDYENAAMLLDAIASCVGHRIVRRWDGTVVSQSASDAKTGLVANLSLVSTRTAGGERADFQPAALIPESFRTTFKDAAAWEVGEVSTKTAVQVWDELRVAKDEFGATAAKTVDAIKTWHCTAEVTTTTSGPTTTPAVTTTLAPGVTTSRPGESWADELTRQLAIDWIDWRAREYDITLPGLIPWVPTGYDDWMQWALGRLERIENLTLLTAATRVQSVPPNVGAEELPIEPLPGTTTTTTTTTTTPGPTTTSAPPTTTADPCATLCSGPGSDVTVSLGAFNNSCYPTYSSIAVLGPVQMLGTSFSGGANGSGVDANGITFTFQLNCSGGTWSLGIRPAADCLFGGSSAGYANSSPTGTFTRTYASGSTTPPLTATVSCGNSTTTPAPTTTVAPTTTATPTTTTAGPCSGTCDWLSAYDAETGLLSWGVTSSNCNGPCGCRYPAACPTAAGQTTTTDCGDANSSPADCTTTAPTTTTPSPCGSYGCAYRWNGSGWDLYGFGCQEGCNCGGPPSLGFTPSVGYISNTPCVSATTTTAAPTTTTTTTTTAAPCAGGTGVRAWNCSGGVWNEEADDGSCDRPSIPAEFEPCTNGTFLNYDCSDCTWSVF